MDKVKKDRIKASIITLLGLEDSSIEFSQNPPIVQHGHIVGLPSKRKYKISFSVGREIDAFIDELIQEIHYPKQK